MPCKTISHSFFYLADYGVQDSALGTYINYLPARAGFLYMYLAYLINLRGEKKREKEKKEKKKEKKEKRRKREKKEDEERKQFNRGETKKRKEEYSWTGRCWQVKRRAVQTTSGRISP